MLLIIDVYIVAEKKEGEKRQLIQGKKIRFYRIKKGMTQEKLCEGICSVSYLSKIDWRRQWKNRRQESNQATA